MRVNEEKISNRRKQRKSQKNRKIILTVAIAIVAITIKNVEISPLKFIAICLIIRPIIRVQNNPSAIPLSATIKYL